MFLALPHLSYTILNHLVVGKTTLLCQKLQQTYYYYRIVKPIIAELMKKHINICCCSFNKISIREKTTARKNLTTKFYFFLM